MLGSNGCSTALAYYLCRCPGVLWILTSLSTEVSLVAFGASPEGRNVQVFESIDRPSSTLFTFYHVQLFAREASISAVSCSKTSQSPIIAGIMMFPVPPLIRPTLLKLPPSMLARHHSPEKECHDAASDPYWDHDPMNPLVRVPMYTPFCTIKYLGIRLFPDAVACDDSRAQRSGGPCATVISC